MIHLIPPRAVKFLCWSFAIWGAGDAVNEAINGRYTSVVLSACIGVGWIWWVSKIE